MRTCRNILFPLFSLTRDVGGKCGIEMIPKIIKRHKSLTMSHSQKKPIEKFALTKGQADSIMKHALGNDPFMDMPKFVRDRMQDAMTRVYRLGVQDGARAVVEGKICDECFGEGTIEVVTPARVEAGIAIDEDRREVECHMCTR